MRSTAAAIVVVNLWIPPLCHAPMFLNAANVTTSERSVDYNIVTLTATGSFEQEFQQSTGRVSVDCQGRVSVDCQE